jgi:hypothetical protein
MSFSLRQLSKREMLSPVHKIGAIEEENKVSIMGK